MLNYLFSLLFTLSTLILFSQKLDLKFEGMTIQDGLSSNTINDINRDCDGFIWIATEDGINRYDGINIKIYRSVEDDPTTLCSNMVHNILYDSCNNFLVGTSAGLNLYNSSLDQFDRVLEDFEIRYIIKYSKGGYLVATNEGVLHLDSSFNINMKFVHDDNNTESLTSNDITAIFEDSKGRVWVSTQQEGVCLLTSSGKFKHFNSTNGLLNGNFCREFIEDHNNRILVTTYNTGVNYYNEVLEQFLPLPALNGDDTNIKKSYAVYEDEDNNLWVGTDGAGLALYDTVQKRYYTYTHSLVSSRCISDNVIVKIFSDKRGGMWVGTHHRGIDFVNKYSSNFKHKEYLPAFENINIVSGFKKDHKGNLWVATDGGGLLYFDIVNRFTEIFEHDKNDPTSLGSNNTLTVETDSNEDVWIGTYTGGVDVYNHKTNKFRHYRNDPNDSTSLSNDIIWKIYRDSHDRMWVCTYEGLCLYQPETNNFKRFTINNTNIHNDHIRDIFEIDSTHFYIGTTDGFIHFDLENMSFKTYLHDMDDSTSISHSFVLNITKDNRDNIWIGTYGGGINLFDPETETFKYWLAKDGLCNNYICGVVTGIDGNLWISTQHGLSKFNPRRNEFQNFYFRDGLQDDKFSIGAILKWNSEKILLGGINGYNSFEPEKIKSNDFAPPLHFTDFKIFNESVHYTAKNGLLPKHISKLDEIILPYNQNMVSFHFAVLNFIQSEKNKVSFFMEGIDKEWSTPANIDKASYTNLSPGEYTFRIKGANNHNVWNPNELSIKLIITPPFWHTWWFRILSGIFIIFLLYIFIKIRMKNVLLQKKTLEQEVVNRTEEINAKNLLLEDKEERRIQSLSYAKLIQKAILPSVHEVKNSVKDLFILYRPLEIVSGDFYWMTHLEGKTIVCAIDCTGHGVPGAFMSMMGNVLLTKIVKSELYNSPAKILETLHNDVVKALHQKQTRNADGMDASIVVIDNLEKTLTFAGAMNPLIYFQNEQIHTIRGTRRGIGGVNQFKEVPFEEHQIDILDETTFYIYSDGYQDQFGKTGKKFMSKRFKQLLQDIHNLPLDKQHDILDKEHHAWRNNQEEQTDDILVIGGRV